MNVSTAHRAYRLHHSGIELHVAEMPALTKPNGGAVMHFVDGNPVNRFGESSRTVADRIGFAFRVADMISTLPDATEAESANARFICD